MPFEVIGKEPDAQMLGPGLQDSLTLGLSGLKGLAVITLKSQADAPNGIAEIGRLHRTALVLACTAQVNADRIV